MPKTRKLFNDKRVKEEEVSVQMTIDSKCPKKWVFVDLETGDAWVHRSRYPKQRKGNNYTFLFIDDAAVDCLKEVADSLLARKTNRPK